MFSFILLLLYYLTYFSPFIFDLVRFIVFVSSTLMSFIHILSAVLFFCQALGTFVHKNAIYLKFII